METVADFGIVTACHRGDYPLAKAACASIRYFMPDVPVCVIVDGDLSIRELEDLYGVIPLRVSRFADPRLQRLCAGSTRSKLAAIWEAPFERFVCFDSDVVVWGDIREKIDLQKNDFVKLTDLLAQERDRENITHFMYHPERIREVRPDFNWIGKWFFCAGAFAARKGCLVLEEYLALEEFSSRSPGVFRFYEQGILNFMVQTYKMDNRMRVGVADLQFIVVDHPRAEVEGRFGRSWAMPPREIREPTLIHFCGEKPWIQNHRAYHALFTAFRFRHYENVFGGGLAGKMLAWNEILKEERSIVAKKIENRLIKYPKRDIQIRSQDMFFKNSKQGRGNRGGGDFSNQGQEGERISKRVADFGVVTGCHAKDYFMAKTTCASIRHFMSDVPICVIVDGDFSIKELEDRYGVIPMRVSDCRSDKLREMCSRSTRSKLMAQWEGPFERYLWVDSDTIVLGDLVHAEPWAEADFWAITTIEPGTVPDRNLRHFFLNPDELCQLDSEFDAHRFPLFCDGVYVARRGCLDLDRTYDMWQKSKSYANLFSWTKSQGLTNYMVFSAQQRGELTVRVCDRQYIVPDHPRSETERRFGTHAKLPPRRWDHAEVVHFCGTKPLVQNIYGYSSLYTAFRLKDRRKGRAGVLGGISAAARVGAEEMGLAMRRLKDKVFSTKS